MVLTWGDVSLFPPLPADPHRPGTWRRLETFLVVTAAERDVAPGVQRVEAGAAAKHRTKHSPSLSHSLPRKNSQARKVKSSSIEKP